MKETNRRKLSGGPEKTVTWIWLDPDGRLKVEFYDFSETAQSMLGNDIAYILTVYASTRLYDLAGQHADTLIDWLAEKFQSYFGIKKWLEENEVEFSVEIDSWA